MSFVIAHITDPHLSPAPLPGFSDLRLKRVMGFINWKRGRERLNDMALLKRLVEDLLSKVVLIAQGGGQYRDADRVPARCALDGDIRRAVRR